MKKILLAATAVVAIAFIALIASSSNVAAIAASSSRLNAPTAEYGVQFKNNTSYPLGAVIFEFTSEENVLINVTGSGTFGSTELRNAPTTHVTVLGIRHSISSLPQAITHPDSSDHVLYIVYIGPGGTITEVGDNTQ